ncbi:hypothetical protein A3K80_04445 [Candidatus Bathyarchaeota archaeon RBG_13_38_9]|nr:MAG: hypothetical protein A3K80_04445 [Candidatus Bathyarchaeota archaeon RBG_13_38_9]
MVDFQSKDEKKRIMKEIITELHKGLSVEEAKDRFEREIGSISSAEIAEVEQSLINEGLSPDEIKKFCNVHALLFKSTLEKSTVKEKSPAHPIFLFEMENREIEKVTGKVTEIKNNVRKYELDKVKQELNTLLNELKNIEIHYARKEQLLFPYLERYGFHGPSKVMWGKDNEIRDLLKNNFEEIKKVSRNQELDNYIKTNLDPLIEEVEGMIFKEETILFPTSLEKLSVDDWAEILKESDDVGYVFIEKPKETTSLIQELKGAVTDEPSVKDSVITFPTGKLEIIELMKVLDILPVDITFVDKDDCVKYFSNNKDRIFVRTRSVLGRNVENCHPPQSVDIVKDIVTSFKEGKRDSVDFWINLNEKLVYIRYYAIRNSEGNYLGTLEVTQDITDVKKLEGEKRLLDEKN